MSASRHLSEMPDTRTGDAKRLEREFLRRLGLSADANPQEVEEGHDTLVAFLETAPRDLRMWASRRIAEADEAYAMLSDPTETIRLAATLSDSDEEEPFEERSTATTSVAPARVPIPDGRRRSAARSRPRPDGHPIAIPASSRLGPVGRVLLAAAAVVAIVTVAYGVYAAGAQPVPGLSGTPAPEASSEPQLDTAKVAELMTKIQSNPKDAVSLQALGDLYFKAGDYATAAQWEQKVLALEPGNATALLGLGAADFNQGNTADAEKQWRSVLAIDPKNLEAHYDLGFMYFSQDPPDVARTTEEWNSVIEIAPDSDIAKTVATHLKTLASQPVGSSAVPSPAASSATGSSASGAPTPVRSTVPSSAPSVAPSPAPASRAP